MGRRSLWVVPCVLAALALDPRADAAAQLAESAVGDPLSRMADLERAIGELTEELEDDTARKGRLEAELAGLGDQKRATRERLYRRTRGLYRMKRAGLMPVAGGMAALLGHVSRVERFERLVAKDLLAVRRLRARGDALRSEAARLEEGLSILRGRLREMEERRAGLSEEILAGRFFREGFGVFEDGASLSPVLGTSLGAGPAGLDPSELVLPVLTMRGVRDVTFEGGPALELATGRGAPVRAVAPGRVGYVGGYAELGRIVIVDHGSDHYAIYGGLDASAVRVSDRVEAGTRVGSVGEGGALFFQLRRGTRALDARGWLGL